MKSSDLKRAFTNQIDVFDLKNIINNEVLDYKLLHRKLGGSIPIYLVEDESFVFGKKELQFLFNLYINDGLDKYEVSYIADAISLSLKIEISDRIVEENLEYLCDLSTSDLSKKDVEKIRNRME